MRIRNSICYIASGCNLFGHQMQPKMKLSTKVLSVRFYQSTILKQNTNVSNFPAVSDGATDVITLNLKKLVGKLLTAVFSLYNDGVSINLFQESLLSPLFF